MFRTKSRRVTSSRSSSNLNEVTIEEDVRCARILVLLTGGTMAMKPNAHGSLEPSAGYLAVQMRLMPELRERRMPAYEVVEYSPLLDSGDFVPSDWQRIANDVAAAHEDYDGFVVIMGTDTMAYTSSALSFMLEGLRKPVILTGSMVPFAEAYSDARRNLVMAMIFAGCGSQVPEVCIFFGDKLLRGNRATKVDALSLGAYDSPNFPPLAKVGVALNSRYDLVLRREPEEAFGPCSAFGAMETKILVFRMIPGFDDAALLRCLEGDKLQAVVLELYGTGTAPARREGFIEALRTAHRNGVLVVATTQCQRGGVVLCTYEVGRQLEEAGVVAAGDMTTEAAATKLAYLFGRYKGDADKVRHLVGVSLRGELSHKDTYLRPFFEAQRNTPIAPNDGKVKPRSLSPPPHAPRRSDSKTDFVVDVKPPARGDRRGRLADVAAGLGLGLAVAFALSRAAKRA